MISSPDYLYAEWTSEETGAVYANILYDLVADPFELNNLASDSSYTAEIRAFERQLDAWIKTTNDLGELPESEIIKYSTQ